MKNSIILLTNNITLIKNLIFIFFFLLILTIQIYDPYEEIEYLLLDITSLGIVYFIVTFLINKIFKTKVRSEDNNVKVITTNLSIDNMEMYTVFGWNIIYYNILLKILSILNLNITIFQFSIVIITIILTVLLNIIYKYWTQSENNSDNSEKEKE